MKKRAVRKVRLNTLLRNENLTTGEAIRKFLQGRSVRPVTTGNGHNYEVGQDYVIDESVSISTQGMTGLQLPSGFGGNTLYFQDCELVDNTKKALEDTKTSLQNTIKRLTSEIASLDSKIGYLTKSKKEVLDEEEWAEWKLEALLSDTTLSQAKKMAAIKELYLA